MPVSGISARSRDRQPLLKTQGDKPHAIDLRTVSITLLVQTYNHIAERLGPTSRPALSSRAR